MALRRRRPVDEPRGGEAAEPTVAPRTGARRTVLGAIRLLPSYVRLLGRLLVDRRVARLDKALVLGAIVYIVSPIDLLPDLLPILGEVDDLFLLVLALQRLIGNAGRRVLLDHWTGDPAELEEPNLMRVLSAAAFFLPAPLRRRLRRLGR